jgi:MFS family permease
MTAAVSSFTASAPLRPRLVALGAVVSVEFIENGIVMFAAGQIMSGLGLSAREFAFAYTLYGVGAIFMLFKHRWMVERLGYRRFVLLSLAVFGLGSLLGALSGGLVQFAAGRLLQGLGGATFFTAGRLAVNDLPEENRSTGFITFLASFLGGSAIAPLLSAALLELGGWRALFWFGVPQSLLVAWLAQAHLSRAVTPPQERSTEHWGWLLWLCVGVFGLQYAIQAIGLDSSRPATIATLALASMLILGIFVWRQWRSERPLINYRGLLQQRYLVGLAMYFFGYFLIGASGLMVPILLHVVLGVSLIKTAAIVSGGLFGSVAVALTHVAVARRWPKHRLFMLAGLTLYGAGSLLLAVSDEQGGWLRFLPALLALYLAIPLFLGPVAAGTFAELHAKVFSHGYQVKNIIRQLGLSSSVAVTSLTLHAFSQDPERMAILLNVSRHIVDVGAADVASPVLFACKQIFALMAMAVIPAGVLVMMQRVFR